MLTKPPWIGTRPNLTFTLYSLLDWISQKGELKKPLSFRVHKSKVMTTWWRNFFSQDRSVENSEMRNWRSQVWDMDVLHSQRKGRTTFWWKQIVREFLEMLRPHSRCLQYVSMPLLCLYSYHIIYSKQKMEKSGLWFNAVLSWTSLFWKSDFLESWLWIIISSMCCLVNGNARRK